MKVSLWSGFYGALPPEQAMQEIASAGFRYSELACETIVDPGAGRFSLSWMERLRAACGASGIETPQLHYPISTLNPRVPRGEAYDPEREADIAHPEEGRRRFELDCAAELMDLCLPLGVRTIVMHPGGCRGIGDESERRRVRELNVEAFSYLARLAAPRGLVLALENMGRVGDRRQYGSSVRELADVIDAVSAPNLLACLDTGHAHYMGEDVPSAIGLLGQRIATTHISDNLGSDDQHLLPYSGTIDWDAVIHALTTVGYRGLLNLEVPGETSCPLPILRLKARHALGLVEAMSDTQTKGTS